MWRIVRPIWNCFSLTSGAFLLAISWAVYLAYGSWEWSNIAGLTLYAPISLAQILSIFIGCSLAARLTYCGTPLPGRRVVLVRAMLFPLLSGVASAVWWVAGLLHPDVAAASALGLILSFASAAVAAVFVPVALAWSAPVLLLLAGVLLGQSHGQINLLGILINPRPSMGEWVIAGAAMVLSWSAYVLKGSFDLT